MKCPICLHDGSRVTNSRRESDYIWRDRVCDKCGYKWRTVEVDEDIYNNIAGVTRDKRERK